MEKDSSAQGTVVQGVMQDEEKIPELGTHENSVLNTEELNVEAKKTKKMVKRRGRIPCLAKNEKLRRKVCKNYS